MVCMWCISEGGYDGGGGGGGVYARYVIIRKRRMSSTKQVYTHNTQYPPHMHTHRDTHTDTHTMRAHTTLHTHACAHTQRIGLCLRIRVHVQSTMQTCRLDQIEVLCEPKSGSTCNGIKSNYMGNNGFLCGLLNVYQKSITVGLYSE